MKLALLIGLLCLGAALLLPHPAEAAGPAAPPAGGVVGTGSPGACTGSELHHKLAGGGLVTFNCGAGPVQIVITPTEVITLDTTLQGAPNITLSGNGVATLFDIESGRVSLSDLTLSGGQGVNGGAIAQPGGQLSITRVTFFNDKATVRGGAIYSSAPLTITQSTFSHDTANLSGGAIHSVSALSVQASLFEHNQAPFDGAVHSQGYLNLSASTFYSNTASTYYAGALSTQGSGAITNTLFLSNTSPSIGGALFNSFGSQLSLSGSTFFQNTASSFGGGLYNLGTLLVNDTTFDGNSAAGSTGGGLAQGKDGATRLLNSTFTNNVAFGGGGLVTSGTLTISNTTFSANTAFGGAAVLAQQGYLTITNSTLDGNDAISGHAIFASGGAQVWLKNTILSGNPSSICFGSLLSLGHNLDRSNTCGLNASGDLTDTDPLLGPLAWNGGPTQTQALLPGSPAIDAGDNSGCPTTDQRGQPRLGVCDLGAYEFAFQVWLPLARR